MKVITDENSERVARYAFEYGKLDEEKSISCSFFNTFFVF